MRCARPSVAVDKHILPALGWLPVLAVELTVPSIYSIVPPNDGSALQHGHHFEPVDFGIDHGRGHHDVYSAGSCQRTYARACGCRQRPRRHREELIESERGWSGRESFVKSVKGVLEPVVAPDALLVSDANRCYPPVAAAPGIPHESINASAGERVRGALHIQTVNAATARSRASCAASAASPPSTWTAI